MISIDFDFDLDFAFAPKFQNDFDFVNDFYFDFAPFFKNMDHRLGHLVPPKWGMVLEWGRFFGGDRRLGAMMFPGGWEGHLTYIIYSVYNHNIHY